MFQSLYPERFRPQLSRIWRLGTSGAIEAAHAAAVELQAEAAGEAALEGCTALQIAWFCFQQGAEIEPGLKQATVAKRIFRDLGSTAGEAAAIAIGAWLMVETGMMEEASADAACALAMLDGGQDADLRSFVTSVLAVVLWYSQQPEQALSLCTEAIALAALSDEPILVAWWRINLAGSYADLGTQAKNEGKTTEATAFLETALAINQEALQGAQAAGDIWCLHLALCNAAEYLCTADRGEEALAHLARCDALGWKPVRRSHMLYLSTRAETLLLTGRATEALPLCQQAILMASEVNDLDLKARGLRRLAAVYERLERYEDALRCFKTFFAAHQALSAEKAQRHMRVASIRYETQKLRQQAEAAEAQVASLMLTSQSDPLTGLPNRRAFDSMLVDLRDTARPFALAIADLDRFKSINDRFSHMVGDAVLREVGAMLVACCPQGGLVARLGGEEFTLVIAGDDAASIMHRCEMLRATIAAFSWQSHHPQLNVTISIGVAWSGEAASPSEVIALADQRLYQAKRLGRNRVIGRPPVARRQRGLVGRLEETDA